MMARRSPSASTNILPHPPDHACADESPGRKYGHRALRRIEHRRFGPTMLSWLRAGHLRQQQAIAMCLPVRASSQALRQSEGACGSEDRTRKERGTPTSHPQYDCILQITVQPVLANNRYCFSLPRSAVAYGRSQRSLQVRPGIPNLQSSRGLTMTMFTQRAQKRAK
ncbi:hypothetical protein EJ03DRAFT_150874 [Teratosphaeria nubilosa]|uniref:Uncharacterized protein n=1 Tax=Teratosphaeria nubilosa TaxID=161662 RepID=A0A6G1LJF0_9PEZI|nr:hypothetical protein EJ03DRAFT_150874 [Teratosphaeria nubilosa]